MIVESMTYEEKIRELSKDLPNYEKYVSDFMKKLVLNLNKNRIGFYNEWIIWTSPRNNKWVFKARIKRDRYVRHLYNTEYPNCFVYFVHKRGIDFFSQLALTGKENGKEDLYDMWGVWTKHFFERYNERYLQTEFSSIIDVAKIYFSEVQTRKFSQWKQEITETEIITNMEAAIESGIELGQVIQNISTNFIYILTKTFVTKEMLFENQQKAWEEAINRHEDDSKFNT